MIPMIVIVTTIITLISWNMELVHPIKTAIPSPSPLVRKETPQSKLLHEQAPPETSVGQKTNKADSFGNIPLLASNRRVTCPDCNRYDFSNVQGFINHCRIAHKIEYASHEDAVRNCGIEVDVSDTPDDTLARPTNTPRQGIQSILNTSSTLSGKLPET
jgi:hypothetical protein